MTLGPRTRSRLALLAKLLVLSGIVWFMVSRVEIRDAAEITAPLEAESPSLIVEEGDGARRPLRANEVSVGERFFVQPHEADAPELHLLLTETPQPVELRVPARLVSPDGPVLLLPGLATAWSRIQLGRLWLPMTLFGCGLGLIGVRWGLLSEGRRT